MLLQYKICNFAFTLMHGYVCPNGFPYGGEEEGDWREGENFSQGYGNKVKLCFVCCPLRIPRQNWNSNKIRHRCALLAQTSIVRKLDGGLVK